MCDKCFELALTYVEECHALLAGSSTSEGLNIGGLGIRHLRDAADVYLEALEIEGGKRDGLAFIVRPKDDGTVDLIAKLLS